MKVIYKYGTGQEIPEGAVYLSTQVELKSRPGRNDNDTEKIRLVWHYFLFETEDGIKF